MGVRSLVCLVTGLEPHSNNVTKAKVLFADGRIVSLGVFHFWPTYKVGLVHLSDFSNTTWSSAELSSFTLFVQYLH